MRFVAGGILSLTLFALPLFGQSDSDRAATLRYLTSLQSPDGGFRADAKSDAPSLRATVSGIRATKYFGGKLAEPEKHLRFLLKYLDPTTGGFSEKPGNPPGSIETTVGLMGCLDLKFADGPAIDKALGFIAANSKSDEEIRMAGAAFEAAGRVPGPKADWVKAIRNRANADGSFGQGAGQVFQTGGTVALLLRLGEQPANRPGLVALLKNGQRSDGGYGSPDQPEGSDLGATYRVMRAVAMLNEKPADAAKLAAWVEKCRNPDGGYGSKPGQPSTASATYQAGIIHHWLSARP